jgi:hypothetical protein
LQPGGEIDVPATKKLREAPADGPARHQDGFQSGTLDHYAPFIRPSVNSARNLIRSRLCISGVRRVDDPAMATLIPYQEQFAAAPIKAATVI